VKINVRTESEGVSEQGAEGDIWDKQERCNRKVQIISCGTGYIKNTVYRLLV